MDESRLAVNAAVVAGEDGVRESVAPKRQKLRAR